MKIYLSKLVKYVHFEAAMVKLEVVLMVVSGGRDLELLPVHIDSSCRGIIFIIVFFVWLLVVVDFRCSSTVVSVHPC